jgi:long-chain acyl-CoA synthetase
MYDTLGPDTVRFILAQTGSKSVVCSRAELAAVCKAKESGECPVFQYAILVDGVIPESCGDGQRRRPWRDFFRQG